MDQGSVELILSLKMSYMTSNVQLWVADCHTLSNCGICKEESGMVRQ